MIREIVFATNNEHKLKEVKEIADGKFEICGLSGFGLTEDIPEDQTTLEGNALQKARYIYDKFGKNCFADDTGLEVECLNGEPGVISARYAGENKSMQENISKLLFNLKDCANRKARFRTVIALIIDNNEYLFEGIINGKIINEQKGQNGFGYDPLFIPDGYNLTFAELPVEVKNKISHRALAMDQLFNFLRKNIK